jgi:Na+/H+ antiporter NhaD/arsenite permease-like protein
MMFAAIPADTPWWVAVPFLLLLAAMAAAPLWFPDAWGRHNWKFAAALGAIVTGHYVFQAHDVARIGSAMFDYVSFISLVGALFVICGGIHIEVKGEATPAANCAFLAVGAVAANILGTTGAAMVLIRPWIRMNKYRFTGHHLAFFIFIVANVGGCLTPIGDPPLFLGYLAGVPFWWVASVGWQVWLTAVATLLAIFFAVDSINFHRAPGRVARAHTDRGEWFRVEGGTNLFLLSVVIAAVVFVRRPAGLREATLLGAAWWSHRTTPARIHAANHFSFGPLREVAILFAAIFATMTPALKIVEARAGAFVQPLPGLFYVASGLLSSVLDNAPTYLTFLRASLGAAIDPALLGEIKWWVQTHGAGGSVLSPHGRQLCAILSKVHPEWITAGTVSDGQASMFLMLQDLPLRRLLLAISAGSVFFGANTYIGNGPNLMVKAIADHAGVHTPNFTRYIWRYSLPFMAPMLALVWLIFFR